MPVQDLLGISVVDFNVPLVETSGILVSQHPVPIRLSTAVSIANQLCSTRVFHCSASTQVHVPTIVDFIAQNMILWENAHIATDVKRLVERSTRKNYVTVHTVGDSHGHMTIWTPLVFHELLRQGIEVRLIHNWLGSALYSLLILIWFVCYLTIFLYLYVYAL